MHRKFLIGLAAALILLALLSVTSGGQAAPEATPVCSNITADTTWTTADSPYTVCGTFVPTVIQGVTLTIEPGVQVEFEQNGRLYVEGTLNALGSPGQPITFTAVVKTPGSWGGLTVNSFGAQPAAANLDYTTFEYGGSGASGGQIYADKGQVSLDHSTLRNGGGYGFYIAGDYPSTVANTAINGHAREAAFLSGARVDLAFSNLSAQGNLQDVIRIGGYSNMAGDRLWKNAGIPYLFVGSAGNQRGDSLTVEPGTEVRFNPNVSLSIGGSLTAIGLPDQPITFTGATAAPGAWNGIEIAGSNSAAATAIFEYATLEDGGGGAKHFNLRIHTGQVQMRHSLVRYSSGDGILNEYYGRSRTLVETSQIYANAGLGFNNLDPTWPVLAINNYWGASSGPTLPTGSACGPGGSGDRISNGIIFRPVLDKPGATPLSPGVDDLRQLSIRPLKWFAPATGSDRVYVALRLTDGKGQPIPGRTLLMGSTLGQVVTGGVTGYDGQTLAYLTSTSAGEAELNAILQTSDACELVRSPVAVVTFTPAGPAEGYLPPESAPYMNDGIQIDPMPVVQGVPTTLSVRLTNPNDFAVTVDGSFSYYQTNIGLTFGPLAEVNGTNIPAHGEAVVQTAWVPPLSGDYCIQFDYSTYTTGLAGRTLAGGSTRRNLKSFPGNKHSEQVRNAYEGSRKAVSTLSNANDGLTFATDPAGFIGGYIPGQLFGHITDFWYDTMDEIDKAMNGDPPRQDYKTISPPVAVVFTPLAPGSGISTAKAAAANAYVAAAMDVYADMRAAAIANDRYGGATKAGDLQWSSLQLATLLFYEKQAADKMPVLADRIDDYVAVVLQENPGDIIMTAQIYADYQARLASTGFTADEIAAAKLLGMTDEEIEAVRQQRLAVNPATMAGSVTARMTRYGETLRLLSDAILHPPAPLFNVSYSVSGGMRRTSAPAIEIATPLDALVRQYAQSTTILVGNPHPQTETVDLSIRPIDLPPDWIVTVSPASLNLGPGESVEVMVSISPGTPLPQGTVPQFAVEGHIGSELIGGVALEVPMPYFVHYDGNQRLYLPIAENR
jgi:hypothetical protein